MKRYRLITSAIVFFAIFFALKLNETPLHYSCDDLKKWYPHLYFFFYLVYRYSSVIEAGAAAAVFFAMPAIIKRKAEFALLVISVIIALSLSEILLRKLNYQAGFQYQTRNLVPVDKLCMYRGLKVTDEGIFCIDTSVYYAPFDSTTYGELFELNDNSKALDTITDRPPLLNYIQEKNGQYDDADSAILKFLKHPVNNEGFRSIDFKPYSSGRKKILMLGDSFIWGHSARNKINSVCDRLLAKGYIIFNTGISGADPAQYLQIAKKYVSSLKPDVVVVNLFLGNDIIYYRRNTALKLPLFYPTNAGNLLGFYNGENLFSAQEAYNSCIRRFMIPHTQNRFNKVCAKTATGTLLWCFINNKLPFITYDPAMYKDAFAPMNYPACNDEIAEIEKICKANNAKLIVSIIPSAEGGKVTRVGDYKNLLSGMKYYERPFDISDYNNKDWHFNDKGHQIYTDFVDSLIRLETGQQ